MVEQHVDQRKWTPHANRFCELIANGKDFTGAPCVSEPYLWDIPDEDDLVDLETKRRQVEACIDACLECPGRLFRACARRALEQGTPSHLQHVVGVWAGEPLVTWCGNKKMAFRCLARIAGMDLDDVRVWQASRKKLRQRSFGAG